MATGAIYQADAAPDADLQPHLLKRGSSTDIIFYARVSAGPRQALPMFRGFDMSRVIAALVLASSSLCSLACASELLIIDARAPTPGIFRADTSSFAVTPIVATNDALRMDIDFSSRQVYWVTFGLGLFRAPIDGGVAEQIISNSDLMTGMALDVDNGFMYWCELSPSAPTAIYRARMDGSNIQQIGSVPPAYGLAQDIAVDTVHDKVYYACSRGGDGSTGRLFRSDLDGGNFEALGPNILNGPYGLLLRPADGKLLYSISSSAFGELTEANLFGMERRVIASGPDIRPVNLAMDESDQTIFFNQRVASNTGIVRKINYDGTGIETLPFDLTRPGDIALIPEPGAFWLLSALVIAATRWLRG